MMVANRPAVPGHTFKAPQYERRGDIEHSILHLEEVIEANEWRPTVVLLHLREALKKHAQDCGRAATIPAIFEALRARYGTPPRETMLKLETLKNDLSTASQEHAVEVGRIVGIAYADLPEEYQDRGMLETICNTLGNAYLQRHLLAVATATSGEAVRAG